MVDGVINHVSVLPYTLGDSLYPVCSIPKSTYVIRHILPSQVRWFVQASDGAIYVT